MLMIKMENKENIFDLIKEALYKRDTMNINKKLSEESPTNDQIKEALSIIIKDNDFQSVLRKVERINKHDRFENESNHCECCNKPHASFGFLFNEETHWYCLEHEVFGKLESLNHDIKNEQNKNIDRLFYYIRKFIMVVKNGFSRFNDKEKHKQDLLEDFINQYKK
jgi:hypothetical protein